VDAAHYEDPRAREFLVRNLIVRRDKIARYWFGRVAPLDFFTADASELHFHDLALDLGLAPVRRYDVKIEGPRRGPYGAGGTRPPHLIRLDSPDLPLRLIEGSSSQVSLEISVEGSGAKPAHVELTKQGSQWVLTRVRHGA